MHPLRRNVRMPSERPRHWPLVVAFVSMVVLCISIVMLRATTSGSRRAAAPPPPAAPIVVPQPIIDEPPAEKPAWRAKHGPCDVSLVPPSMVEKVSATEAAELVTLVHDWLSWPDSFGLRPSIMHKRGIAFVESQEDRGDDPPYPRSAAPEAERVCGSAAQWLRSHAHERLVHVSADAPLECSSNVCCYAGMEYSPDGILVFRRRTMGSGGESWSLDAWIEIHERALVEDVVDANRQYVKRSLARLAHTRCAGEPAGRD